MGGRRGWPAPRTAQAPRTPRGATPGRRGASRAAILDCSRGRAGDDPVRRHERRNDRRHCRPPGAPCASAASPALPYRAPCRSTSPVIDATGCPEQRAPRCRRRPSTSPVLGCVNANTLCFRMSSKQAFMSAASPRLPRGTDLHLCSVRTRYVAEEHGYPFGVRRSSVPRPSVDSRIRGNDDSCARTIIPANAGIHWFWLQILLACTSVDHGCTRPRLFSGTCAAPGR